MSTKKPYVKTTAPTRTPTGGGWGHGVPEWVEDRILQLVHRDGSRESILEWSAASMGLPGSEKTGRRIDPLPKGAWVEVHAQVFTDAFLTTELTGMGRYEPARALVVDDADYSYCGDGCCGPWDVPSAREALWIGDKDLGELIEVRDDVVTRVEIEGTLVGPTMATFCLAHMWQEEEGGPLLPPGTVLTRPLHVFESLDHSGRVARKWTPVTSGATPAF